MRCLLKTEMEIFMWNLVIGYKTQLNKVFWLPACDQNTTYVTWQHLFLFRHFIVSKTNEQFHTLAHPIEISCSQWSLFVMR